MHQVTMTQFMTKLATVPALVEAAVYEGLVKAAVEVQKTAVEKFGKYQPAVGPYPGWALLSINTVNRKMDYGGASGPNPLIGSYGPGDKNTLYPVPLRNSIQIDVRKSQLAAYVGTNDPLGEWHEYGSEAFNVHYPPRPFLRPALYEKQDYVHSTIRGYLGAGLDTGLR